MAKHLVDLDEDDRLLRAQRQTMGSTDRSLDAFAAVETTAAHVRRALHVQRLLAQRSQRGRKIPDLLVAAAAEEHNLTVLHYDGDFDLIAELTGQRCQWIVPAGSAD